MTVATIYDMTTADRILRELRRHEMRPADLANELGVSRAQVHRWVHSDHEPNLESVRRMARVFKCAVADLIGTTAA